MYISKYTLRPPAYVLRRPLSVTAVTRHSLGGKKASNALSEGAVPECLRVLTRRTILSSLPPPLRRLSVVALDAECSTLSSQLKLCRVSQFVAPCRLACGEFAVSRFAVCSFGFTNIGVLGRIWSSPLSFVHCEFAMSHCAIRS